jgi:hypothetical protein
VKLIKRYVSFVVQDASDRLQKHLSVIGNEGALLPGSEVFQCDELAVQKRSLSSMRVANSCGLSITVSWLSLLLRWEPDPLASLREQDQFGDGCCGMSPCVRVACRAPRHPS